MLPMQLSLTVYPASGLTSVTRTIQVIGTLLQPLETKLIPALTGQQPPNDEVRDLLSLPARLGGIALTNPTSAADVELPSLPRPSQKAILQHNFEYSNDVINEQVEAKGEVCSNVTMVHYVYTAPENNLSSAAEV